MLTYVHFFWLQVIVGKRLNAQTYSFGTHYFFKWRVFASNQTNRLQSQTKFCHLKGTWIARISLFYKKEKVFQVSTNLHFLSLPHAKLLIARRPSNTFALIDITLHVGFPDTENHSGDFIFLLVVAPALDNSVSTENFSIAADGDASEVRTHVPRMKISYPDRLDDGAEYSGL